MATAHRTEPIHINEVAYIIMHMDVRKQLHIARRLAPLVGAMGGVLRNIYVKGFFKVSENADLEKLDAEVQERIIVTGLETIETAGPLIGSALAKMSDDDSDYIINQCLACVKRKNGNAWSPVFNNGVIMFDDLGVDVIMKLVWLVIKDNIISFFPTALLGREAAGKEVLN